MPEVKKDDTWKWMAVFFSVVIVMSVIVWLIWGNKY